MSEHVLDRFRCEGCGLTWSHNEGEQHRIERCPDCRSTDVRWVAQWRWYDPIEPGEPTMDVSSWPTDGATTEESWAENWR